jgi:hypothetical protein
MQTGGGAIIEEPLFLISPVLLCPFSVMNRLYCFRSLFSQVALSTTATGACTVTNVWESPIRRCPSVCVGMSTTESRSADS